MAGSIIGGVGSLASGILGMIQSNQQNKWNKGAAVNVLNAEQGAYGDANQYNKMWSGQANNGANAEIGTGQALYGNPYGGALSTQAQAYGALTGLDPSQFSGGPGAAEALAVLNSPQWNQSFDASAAMGSGQQPGQQQMVDTGTGMMQYGGNTDLTAALQNYAKTGLTESGTATANGLSAAQNLLSANPQLAQAILGAQKLQAIGNNYAAQPALIPTGLAASMARDQAGAQAANAAQAAQAQALARGGGPGATVANGAANAGLADFANQIQQAQASAYQNAVTQQQGLNLQQQGQGAQMALGAGNNISGLEGTQNQQYSTGFGGITNLEGALGNLGLGAGAQATNNVGVGGNLTSEYLNSLLGGENATTGAGSAMASGLNNAGNLNLQGTLDYNNVRGNYLNALTGINQFGAGMANNGINTFTTMGGQQAGIMNTALGAEPSAVNGYIAATSGAGSPYNGTVNGASNAFGGLGNIGQSVQQILGYGRSMNGMGTGGTYGGYTSDGTYLG